MATSYTLYTNDNGTVVKIFSTSGQDLPAIDSRVTSLEAVVTTYVIPVFAKGGAVSVSYSDLGLSFENPAVPSIQPISVKPYLAALKTATAEGFTAQLFQPDGTAAIDTEEKYCCGESVSGQITCGEKKKTSTVNLVVKMIQ